MNERMVSRSKVDVLEQQFRDTDAARMRAEQDRNTAYARIAELEAAVVEARTQRGDSVGLFAGDRMVMTAELLATLVEPHDDVLVVEVVSVVPGADGTKGLLLRYAGTPDEDAPVAAESPAEEAHGDARGAWSPTSAAGAPIVAPARPEGEGEANLGDPEA